MKRHTKAFLPIEPQLFMCECSDRIKISRLKYISKDRDETSNEQNKKQQQIPKE